VAAFAVGLALTAMALGAGRGEVRRWPRGELAVVLLLTLAAFAVRAWRLDALRVLIDEGNSIDNLFRADSPDTSLLLPPSQYVTTMLHPAWQAFTVALAGPSLIGLRLSSAIIGALTVPVLWVLARALFDRSTALAAAVILAGFAPHVHFSRIGLPHIGDALFGTAALAGIAAGLAGGGRLAWTLGGIALGLTHYGFEAGRWFFTPLVVVWLAALAVVDRARFRAAGAGVKTLAVACGLTLLPLYGALLGSGGEAAPRLRTSSLNPAEATALLRDPAAAGRHLAVATGVFLWEPERAEYYGGEGGLVSPLLAPFVLLGFAVCVWRPRSPAILMPLWLGAAWMANVAMRDPAVYARWVVALPALALAAGCGLAAAAAWVRALAGDRRAETALLGVAALLAVAQVHQYFARHIDRLAAQARDAKPYRDAYDAALRAAALLPRGEVLVISDPEVDVHPPRSLLHLLSAGRDEFRFDCATPAAVDATYLAALPADRDRIFFVAPDDRATVDRLAACFELDGPRRTAYAVAPAKQLDLYLARAGSRRAACGS
jgi:hypothetical protein